MNTASVKLKADEIINYLNKSNNLCIPLPDELDLLPSRTDICKNKKSIEIPDNLTCEIKERLDKHIILPEEGLLNNEELEKQNFLIKQRRRNSPESPNRRRLS